MRHVPFFLDDNTGKVLVDPRGAELDIHRDFHEEYSDSVFSSHDLVPPQVSDFLTRHGVSAEGHSVRIDEYCIKPKNFLFILGTLAENPGITVGPSPISTNGSESLSFEQTVADHLSSVSFSWGSAPSVVSPLFVHSGSAEPGKEEVPVGDPGSSASDTATQQSRIAAALMRAGITNPAAWNVAGIDPGTSVRSVDSPFGNMNPESPSPEPWDLHPPVVLMKGKNNPVFLISWKSQGAVLATLSWKSTLMIWGGPILTLACLYLIAAQFGLL
jgi:E3 Ubiquitin ligase